MSNFDGIGGRYSYNRVPAAPGLRNQQLQNPTAVNGVIKSAVWDETTAGPDQSVPFTIMLNKVSIMKKAVVEVFLNQPDCPAMALGPAVTLPAATLIVKGSWYSGNRAAGRGSYYTFSVRVDNQTMWSNELRLVNDPVAKAVRRINSDGFDR